MCKPIGFFINIELENLTIKKTVELIFKE